MEKPIPTVIEYIVDNGYDDLAFWYWGNEHKIEMHIYGQEYDDPSLGFYLTDKNEQIEFLRKIKIWVNDTLNHIIQKDIEQLYDTSEFIDNPAKAIAQLEYTPEELNGALKNLIKNGV